jgi:hypothetical protein
MIDFQGQTPDIRYTPEWWINRLSRRLAARRPILQRWEDYYTGKLNLALASEKWRSEFASRFPAWTTNFMALVVDKHRERLQVQGIRFSDEDDGSDDEAWAWWQSQHMDSESLKLFREALVQTEAHVLVWPDRDGIPEVSIESPMQTIVDSEPGRAWKRRAALKRFLNEDGRVQAELYLPDGIYKYVSEQNDAEFSMANWSDTVSIRWKRLETRGEPWPIPNKTGVVPIVPFVHRPNLANVGESEIATVASSQDAINKYRVDAFVASEFASFRQRWATGIDIPVDPVTGEPIEPFRAAVDRLWVVPPPDPEEYADAREAPEVRFGEFDVTPLEPFYKAITGEIQMLGAISRTPYHYLLPQSGQPPSGESLRAAEAGLVAKVFDTHVSFGESFEEVFRLNFLQRGDPRGKLTSAEVLWRDPETKNESALVDALGKMAVNLGVPPQVVKRWRRMALEQAIEDALRIPSPETPAPPPAIRTGPVTGDDDIA